jgi:hypothetical protein
MRVRRLSLSLVCVALLAAAAPAAWAKHKQDPHKLAATRVRDLHYGDVLFHYWSDEDSGLQTLTLLEAYTQWNRMPNHEADAQLLAAGLYLQLGMHNEAGRRFETLLGERLPQGVRNQAWFYLAKIWYERGYYDRSEDALKHIGGKLAAQPEAERTHLLVNVLMRQGRYDEAIAILKDWHGPADWMAYAQFNLGVALVRAGRLPEADPMLTAVGTLSTYSPELLNLRDKGNLALGYAYLQAEMPAQALIPLARVRLEGPYSSRALLGDGWARAALKDYQAALAPWLELHKRGLLDAAVQESYLAVPYAYGQLGAATQAAESYEEALKSFASESDNLDQAIANIRAGHLLDDLMSSDKGNANTYGWFYQLKSLPDSPQSRYLYSLLADNDFQEGLKNWRDLGYLQRYLARWDDSMDAFAAMIDTREKAYAKLLPQADALLAGNAPVHLTDARAAADSRLNAIEIGDDVAALGTPEERDQWTHISHLEEQANAMPKSLERDEAVDKIRLIKGVLYWRLDAAFKQRSYDQHHQLQELDAELDELQNRWVRVQKARATVPTNTGDFAARIAALADRIKAARARLADSSDQQSKYLASLAESELQSQRDRLTTYSLQARVQLADIYDRTSDAPEQPSVAPPAPGAEPTPEQRTVPEQNTAPEPTPAAPPEQK